MNDNNAQMFNIISIVFLVLSVLMLLFVIVQLVTGGEPERVYTAADYPTQIPATETFTPTATNTPTTPPTFTPVPTATDTPIPSPTASITAAPSSTITATAPSSSTPAPTNTPPGTATTDPASVTRTPTESPFFFGESGPVEFRANAPDSGLGCTFQAIGGRVIGLDGLEHPGGLQVHVIGQDNDVDRVREIGTNTLYGTTSGWEVPVASQAIAGQYVVRLESLAGTQLSSDVRVQFFGDCQRVIAVVEFQQSKPLPGG